MCGAQAGVVHRSGTITDVESRAQSSSGRGRVLVFDVLGSLLDEDEGQRRAVAATLDLPPEQATAFIEAWSSHFDQLMRTIWRDREPYRTSEALHLQSIVESAGRLQVALPGQTAVELSRFGRTLAPFPDVPAAVAELSRSHPLVALTNAGSAQAFAMSRHAGLSWTYLVSGEVVHAFKPDPRMYSYVLEALDLVAEQCFFVAAHPWDLAAAAGHGFRTALLDRAGTGGDFDVVAEDLGALVVLLHQR